MGNFDEKFDIHKSIKKIGKIVYIRLNFVVQLDNYKEMKQFITFAKKFNADEVWFQRITNWGTISQEDFLNIDVFDERNPLYGDAISILTEIKKENKLKISENCI